MGNVQANMSLGMSIGVGGMSMGVGGMSMGLFTEGMSKAVSVMFNVECL